MSKNTSSVKDTRKPITAKRRIIASCSPNLARYFAMLPGIINTKINNKDVEILNIRNLPLMYDGEKFECLADIYFADPRDTREELVGLGDKLVRIVGPIGKLSQLLKISEYNKELPPKSNFKMIPSEICTRPNGIRSFSGQSAVEGYRGFVIKSLSNSDGENQIAIKYKDPEKRFTKEAAKNMVNKLYYWLGNAFFENKQHNVVERVNLFIKSLEGDDCEEFVITNTTSKTTQVYWLGNCSIQPMLDIKDEYRVFMQDGKPVKIQHRPRNKNPDYEQLRLGPDVDMSLEECVKDPLVTEFLNELHKFVPDMCSVDVFTTPDGKWGVFEFGTGYSPLASNFTWVSEYFKTYIISEINKRFK